MIFLKNNIDSLLKKEIKGVFPEEGEILVKYNISYPETEQKNGFSKIFNGFYSMLSKRFESFAKTRLYKEALRYRQLEEDFQPFGAVLRYVCAYCDENVLSIVTDAYVYCGGEKTETKRMSQNWDIKTGRLLLFEDFFKPSDKENIITGIKSEGRMREKAGLSCFFRDYEKKLKSGFSKNDFYLTPKGYGFFYPAGSLSDSKETEVFFLLGFKGNGEFNPY